MRVARRLAVLAAGVLSVGLLIQSPASGMTSGSQPDGNGHPGVVALVYVGSWGEVRPFCSGMLIAPTVVLTASHCLINTVPFMRQQGLQLGVTNDPSFTDVDDFGWSPTSNLTGLEFVDLDSGVFLNPLYRGGYREDVSALRIGGELPGVDADDIGVLPEEGLLDRLQAEKRLRSTASLVLGYGVQEKNLPANSGPRYTRSNERRYAELPTLTIDSQFLRQDQNIGKNPEQGGACYGDSGGPSLMTVDGRTYVVGVTSTGDGPCFATNVASRVDRPAALALLRPILAAAAE